LKNLTWSGNLICSIWRKVHWNSYSTPVWTPCQHKLTFYNGENLHQISVNYVYRQALNCRVGDRNYKPYFKWLQGCTTPKKIYLKFCEIYLEVGMLTLSFFWNTIVSLWKRRRKIENETIVFKNNRFLKMVVFKTHVLKNYCF